MSESKILISSSKACRIRVSLKGVLHPPDDGVHPVRGGLDGGLEVVGGEGNVFHGEVGLKCIGNVLIAWNNVYVRETTTLYSLYPRIREVLYFAKIIIFL